MHPAAEVKRTATSSVLLTNGALVLDEEPGAFVFGTWRNVMVLVWHKQATADALVRLSRVVENVRAEYPRGRSSVHVVIGGAAPPTDEAQAAFVRLASDPHLACLGVVFLGSGFWASGLRANSTRITVKSGAKAVFRHHETIEELTSWLPEEHEKRTGVKVRADTLISVIKAFANS
jgi:hypothetical protein